MEADENEEVKILQEAEPQEKVMGQESELLGTDSQVAQLEAQPLDKKQSFIENILKSNEAAVNKIVIELSSPEGVDNTDIETKSVERSFSIGVAIEDMDELGLCPITADDDENTDDEMPSLIMLDDEDQADELNQTFEINDDSSEDLNEFNAVEQPIKDDKPNQLGIDMPKLRMSPEKRIKIVLTNEYDQDKTLLKMEHSLTDTKSNAYRFPTPYKNTSKMNFKFTDGNLTQHLELNESSRRRRRSKSVCGETTKNVTFYSPIEVADVSDIDRRMEKFNNNRVTQRRKRSKSLDNPFIKSRIPQPSKPSKCLSIFVYFII